MKLNVRVVTKGLVGVLFPVFDFFVVVVFLVSQLKRSLTYYAGVSSIWSDSLTSNIIRDPCGSVSWPVSGHFGEYGLKLVSRSLHKFAVFARHL